MAAVSRQGAGLRNDGRCGVIEQERRIKLLLVAAAAVGLAGCAWALASGVSCAGCSRASHLVGDVNLAALGAAFYALLLAGGLFVPRSPVTQAAALAAGGVHLALLGILAGNQLFCPACLLTAGGGFGAAGAALALDRRDPWRSASIVMAAAVAANLGTGFLARGAEVRGLQEVKKAARSVRGERPVPPGRARIVAFIRPACAHCREYKERVLPVVLSEYGEKLVAEQRPAWKGLWTPSVVVLGRKDTVFPGNPSVEDLRRAVRQACEGEGPAPRDGLPL